MSIRPPQVPGSSRARVRPSPHIMAWSGAVTGSSGPVVTAPRVTHHSGAGTSRSCSAWTSGTVRASPVVSAGWMRCGVSSRASRDRTPRTACTVFFPIFFPARPPPDGGMAFDSSTAFDSSAATWARSASSPVRVRVTAVPPRRSMIQQRRESMSSSTPAAGVSTGHTPDSGGAAMAWAVTAVVTSAESRGRHSVR